MYIFKSNLSYFVRMIMKYLPTKIIRANNNYKSTCKKKLQDKNIVSLSILDVIHSFFISQLLKQSETFNSSNLEISFHL